MGERPYTCSIKYSKKKNYQEVAFSVTEKTGMLILINTNFHKI